VLLETAKPAPPCSAAIKLTAGFIRPYIPSSLGINPLPLTEGQVQTASPEATILYHQAFFWPGLK
jgi:hypothetical protein